MRMFLDCRSRLNEPRFIQEIDPENDEILTALLAANESAKTTVIPSSDGEDHKAAFRVLDVEYGEGAVYVKLMHAVPLH